MRSGFITDKIPYIVVVLAFLLQGCGHKGPLMLPEPKAPAAPSQTSPAQTTSDQTTSPKKTDLPPATAK